MAHKGEPPNLAHYPLIRLAGQPVEAWEAARDASTDPREREHMTIAINARKRMEATSEAP